MARQLKAKAPDATKVTKPKIIVFGPPGVRKTWVSIEFPNVYYIDTEGGCSLPAYQKKLNESGGVYFGKDEGSQNFDSVIEEIETLATTEHPFLTLVIDSFSKLYNMAAAKAEDRVGNKFGADKKEAQKPTRRLMRWLDQLDMNVLLICHSKEKWRKEGKELISEGQTFDGYDKLEYELHLCLHVDKGGARVTKSRLEGFQMDSRFPWTFQEIEKRCTSGIMLRRPVPIHLASEVQLAELKRLLAVVKLPEEWEEKALAKAGVEDWEDVDAEKVNACIKYLTNLVKAEVEK